MLAILRRLLGLDVPVATERASSPTATTDGETAAFAQRQKVRDLRETVRAAELAVPERIFELAGAWIADAASTRPELMNGTADEALGAMIAEIDAILSVQLTEILHHPRFRALESAWRGLDYLLSNVDRAEGLLLRTMDISREELPRSPLSRLILEDVFGAPDGLPYGLLVLDHAVADCEEDAALIGEFARICAKAQTLLIAGLSPDLYTSEDFADTRMADGKSGETVLCHPAWEGLRRHAASRYIGLCLPRMLGRLPYGETVSPAEAFSFEEGVTAETASDFLWINSAFAMAANVGRAVSAYGWAVQIRGVSSGGEVTGLPELLLPSPEGNPEVIPPVEIAIGERREAQLAKAGLMPLLHRKGSSRAVFIGAQSLNMPSPDDVPGSEKHAQNRILSRFPYLLCATRYAHHAMRMAADWRGSLDASFEAHVQAWLDRNVHPRPWELDPVKRALYPLQGASFTLIEGGDSRRAELEILPGYQLEGVGIAIRLGLTLPG